MGPGGYFVLPGMVSDFIIENNILEDLFSPFKNTDNNEIDHIYALAHEKIINHLLHKLEIH